MKRLFTILALVAAMAFSTIGCAIFTERPHAVERHYYSPNYNFYPPDGVYYWYGCPYYTRPPYVVPMPAPRPPQNHGYTPRPHPPRPDAHRPTPLPQNPRPAVPTPPRQPANTPNNPNYKAPYYGHR